MKWNSVKDKMPTEFDKSGFGICSPNYLCHEKYNTTLFIGYYHYIHKEWCVEKSNYNTSDCCSEVEGNILSENVDFWMELPAEPKEG